MKKIICILLFLIFLAPYAQAKVVSNEKINETKVTNAEAIMLKLQNETQEKTKEGFGPFGTYIYDDKGILVSKGFDSCVKDKSSISYAEINAIKEAEKFYGTPYLSNYNLTVYTTSEPNTTSIGAILFSGIKNVYFGVPNESLKSLIGIDNGIKTNWIKDFKKRKITVYGGINQKIGEKLLFEYVGQGFEILR